MFEKNVDSFFFVTVPKLLTCIYMYIFAEYFRYKLLQLTS